MSVAASTWAVPGVPRPRPVLDGPTDDLVLLRQAVDEVLAVRPGLLSPEAAVVRAAGLLMVQERLQAACLAAVGDVDDRDLHLLDEHGSARGWLRAQVCGDSGQLASARALAERPLLRAAVADGAVSVKGACTAARALTRVPATVDEDELRAVLVDGVGQALAVWAGSACLAPTPQQEDAFEVRRDRLVEAVTAGLTDTGSRPADRLEPAFALLAEALTPAELPPAVGLLVDALQPEAAEAEADADYRSRDLVLRKLTGGGWSLRAHLTDEVGQHLSDALKARDRRHASTPAGPRPVDPTGLFEDAGAAPDVDDLAASEPEEPGDAAPGVDDLAAYGTAGPGVAPVSAGDAVEGTPVHSPGQRLHDALATLLADLTNLPATLVGSGAPAPAGLVLTATLDTLQGHPGAPPPLLRTRQGPVPVTLAALQRIGCGAFVAGVLLDADRRPVGASGEHRHATTRERRAMYAAWGWTCAVNACGLLGGIPHHGEPWWKTGRTTLADLLPVCHGHHHDVHHGKTLRLRDGRSVNAWGWC